MNVGFENTQKVCRLEFISWLRASDLPVEAPIKQVTPFRTSMGNAHVIPCKIVRVHINKLAFVSMIPQRKPIFVPVPYMGRELQVS